MPDIPQYMKDAMDAANDPDFLIEVDYDPWLELVQQTAYRSGFDSATVSAVLLAIPPAWHRDKGVWSED